MHGIGRSQKLQRRAHADTAILTLDRGGPQHEAALPARDHIKRKARMNEAHRARQLDLRRLNQDDLALDAAQLAIRSARGEPAAIDHDAFEFFGCDVAVESNRTAGGANPRMQFRQPPARLDMALVGIEQALAEPPGERGLELADALRI